MSVTCIHTLRNASKLVEHTSTVHESSLSKLTIGLPPESSSMRFCGRNRATTLILFADMIAVAGMGSGCKHQGVVRRRQVRLDEGNIWSNVELAARAREMRCTHTHHIRKTTKADYPPTVRVRPKGAVNAVQTRVNRGAGNEQNQALLRLRGKWSNPDGRGCCS